MQVSFSFDDPAEAANVLEFILGNDWPDANAGRPTTSGASANRNGTGGGGSASASADEEAPWEDQRAGSSQRASEPADEDPWAESASGGSKASTARSAPSEPKTTPGKDFPKSGTYDKQTKSGLQVWEFGKDRAPNCNCGHVAAQVKGYKGKDHASGKPSWTAYWCPAGFAKAWKDACKPDDFSF